MPKENPHYKQDNAMTTNETQTEPVKTLRDEMAIAAMQGMRVAGLDCSEDIAEWAYYQADAMLIAREEGRDE